MVNAKGQSGLIPRSQDHSPGAIRGFCFGVFLVVGGRDLGYCRCMRKEILIPLVMGFVAGLIVALACPGVSL